MRITATWTLVPCLNFYRDMYHLNGWEPLEGQNGNHTLASGDYVVFDPGASKPMSCELFTAVFIDRLSGAFVAVHR